MRVVLGVGGGIAAYKACLLSRLFSERGAAVTVVPTEAALRFVGAPTWEALSGRPVSASVFDGVDEVRHVRVGQEADVVVVAPATADLLARAAHGLANDLLTNVLLTARCPVVMAPAMHTEMWLHAATQANVALLRARGVTVVEPASGRLTGADSGPGRLPDPEAILGETLAALARGGVVEASTEASGELWRGRRVVVTAGGTREPVDPVRFIGNRSSGKQGYAIAVEAARRGASVDLISAHVDIPAPDETSCRRRISLVRVESALEMKAAVDAAAPGADVIVMAAAVADFRPRECAGHKIKKSHEGAAAEAGMTIELIRNPDILAGLVERREHSDRASEQVIVGFAAETGDPSGSVLDLARRKLARKGCDLLVANEVGQDVVFGQDDTTVSILRQGCDTPVRELSGSKRDTACALLDVVEEFFEGPGRGR
ncbi:phosphopantothenoylcysteine decarboxylase / phosphopantothenate--cysteine ligase [Austwickia chelonae]|uniref:Coenzyme A biosynthesis bifunctional protein CoaBC n=1 Tax=Austwickia chelonae NBRC 105200 TaxID=1184607 RepID=K6V622_9MICO|nr:bifunctional phosphopantothenoylcysteine decarboxylase/phosphopantothenate--cysteine ligase CoaBC [Austwickia chelonae]GAB77678.1 coenzyme A biosynthesis bifunctional protein CoaBC [Austwickia chelonae NBRC 105200]SEW15563.1 phosphopantothenoylcysteine decarboxylase / phosphopantothenate--cysteine ligase [Austwickia chelonae]